MAEDEDEVMLLSELSDKELGRLGARQILGLGIKLRPARVLLADADAAVREYVGAMLESLGMEVIYATTPDEAEQALHAGEVALALVDFVEDPDDSLGLFDDLLNIDDEAETGIFLFTANKKAVTTIAGMYDPQPALNQIWLPKPFDLEKDFIPVLASFLGACED